MKTQMIIRYFCQIVFYAGIATQISCSPTDPGNAKSELTIVEATDFGVINQDDNLRGRDGGYSGAHNGRITWVFGDTVTINPNADGQTWFSNSWSAIEPTNVSQGLPQLNLGKDSNDETIELLPFTEAENQFNTLHRDAPGCTEPCGARWALWPGPIVDDPARQRSLVFYQKIKGLPGEFNLNTVGTALAEWPYEADRPVRPVIDETAEHPTVLFPPDSPQLHNAALVEDDVLYAFACERDETVYPCRLSRAPLDQALNPDAWRHATGSGEWSENSSLAVALFHGADIMSVSFNDHLDRYIAVYSKPLSREIVIRSAPTLTGPWTVPTHVANALPSANTNGWVYDGLSHPLLSTPGDPFIYVTYTRDPGTAWFAREMRLLRVTLAPKLEVN